MANTDTKWCDDLGTFLSFEQVNFCKKNFKVMDFLSSGGELALRHCQRVMKYERWLCADDTSKFVGDKKLYYILNEGSKSNMYSNLSIKRFQCNCILLLQ